MSREPREPTPSHGDDVPDVVLDELRQAFTGTPPQGSSRTDPDPTAFAGREDDTDVSLLGDLTFDDLPMAEVDDLRDLSADESGAGFRRGTDDSVFGPDPLLGGVTGTEFSELTGLTGLTGLAGQDGPPTAPWVPDVPPATRLDDDPAEVRPARTTIIIGGDDSLPDAVYLDDDPVAVAARSVRGDAPVAAPGAPGATDAVGERGTIVIGDELEASGAFDAVAVPSRSMDPRVRARRIAVKRAQGRKRLLIVSGVGGAVLVLVAVLAVFSSSLFAVERVDVQGAPYTRARYADGLQAVIDRLIGEPVLLVDTRSAEEELESLPWVERAFVTTDFPDRVLIDIRERQPLATFQGSDGQYRVIDRAGFVLDVLAGRPAGYMLVEGIGPDLGPGATAGAPYAAAAQLVGALPAEIRDLTVAATLDPTTGDLGLVLQVVPGVDTTGTGDVGGAGDGTGDGSDDGSGEAGDGSGEPGDAAPVLVTVRIGSFTGLDGKLARLLQLLRDGIGDTTAIDVATDDVIG